MTARVQEDWDWSDFSSVAFPDKGCVPQLNPSRGATPDGSSLGAPLALAVRNNLIALNQATCEQALLIQGAQPQPLELVVGAGCGQFSLDVPEGAAIILLERVGAAAVNQVAQIKLHARSSLKHVRFFETSAAGASAATSFLHYDIELAEGSAYETIVVSGGGLQQRVDHNIKLMGEGASAKLSLLALLSGTNHCDFGASVFHLSPKTFSNFQARSVVSEEGVASFRPSGFIGEKMSEVELHQLTKGVLLSDQARMNAKPELAIYNDDVVCSHGVACVSLDKDALFYLHARGLSEKAAKEMLLLAFITELLGANTSALEQARLLLSKIL